MAKGTAIAGRRNKGIAKANRERRRAEAMTRQEAYDNLAPVDKIKRLDERLGKGKGAEKERMRILASWNRPGDGQEHIQETRIEDLPKGCYRTWSEPTTKIVKDGKEHFQETDATFINCTFK